MLRRGACGEVTGGGGSRREGECAGPLLSGERKRYRRGRAEALPERPAAGVRARAPDLYSRGRGGVKGGARGAVAGGGVTAGGDRRRDKRCRDRREQRRSHGRGRVQSAIRCRGGWSGGGAGGQRGVLTPLFPHHKAFSKTGKRIARHWVSLCFPSAVSARSPAPRRYWCGRHPILPLAPGRVVTPAPCGHPNISPVDWNEGPDGWAPVARNPCNEGTAFLSGLPPPRKMVRPRRRTGFVSLSSNVPNHSCGTNRVCQILKPKLMPHASIFETKRWWRSVLLCTFCIFSRRWMVF